MTHGGLTVCWAHPVRVSDLVQRIALMRISRTGGEQRETGCAVGGRDGDCRRRRSGVDELGGDACRIAPGREETPDRPG